MSTSATSPEHAEDHASGHDDHGHGDHHPHLAHHFEDLDQQFEAGKLGIWLFLAQEVLFFSGMFAAYTVYRYHHPEVFVNASHHLNVTLGAINTVVLLASSLAIAWGVRAAMRNDRRTVIFTHMFTLLCAGLFMGVKTIEYTHKWDEGIFPAGSYTYVEGSHISHGYWHDQIPKMMIISLVAGIFFCLYGAGRATAGATVRGWVMAAIGISLFGVGGGIVLAKCIMPTAQELARAEGHGAHASHAHDDEAHVKAEDHHEADTHAKEAVHHDEGEAEATVEAVPREKSPVFFEGNFFSIYFIMTGIHAVHIIAGMIAITWIVVRSALGHFDAEYYGPIEFVGLYWHLVDLVWIYLFPLMYLIH